jgi:polysaccharide pyruvyl transferase WcaK-like protein
MRPKKTLIVGAFGTGNLGDDAILEGLLTKLKNEGRSKDDVVVFSRNPIQTEILSNVAAKRKNLFDIILCDEIIIGGGQLLQEGGWMAPKYSVLSLIAKLLGKHVTFFAVGVSPIKSRIVKALVRLSLNIADEISVRDLDSRYLLRNFGVTKKILITKDSAFYIEPISNEDATHLLAERNIKINGRKILVAITSQHFRAQELKKNPHDFLNELIGNLLRKYNDVYFLFIPFTNHIDSRLDNDIIYGRWLENKLNSKRFKVLDGKYTPQEILGIISLFDYVISTRLHPLIFAFKVNVLGIGIDVFEKVRSFCSEYGLPIIHINEPIASSSLVEKLIDQKIT